MPRVLAFDDQVQHLVAVQISSVTSTNVYNLDNYISITINSNSMTITQVSAPEKDPVATGTIGDGHVLTIAINEANEGVIIGDVVNDTPIIIFGNSNTCILKKNGNTLEVYE